MHFHSTRSLEKQARITSLPARPPCIENLLGIYGVLVSWLASLVGWLVS